MVWLISIFSQGRGVDTFILSARVRKTGFMENERIKSRPGKVIENDNLAKSHGNVMEFKIFTNVSYKTFGKNVLITYTFVTQ